MCRPADLPRSTQNVRLSGFVLLQAKSDAQQLFGLPATEETLETFSCALVQTYSCRHNAFTGPKEVASRPCVQFADVPA